MNWYLFQLLDLLVGDETLVSEFLVQALEEVLEDTLVKFEDPLCVDEVVCLVVIKVLGHSNEIIPVASPILAH